MSKTTGKSLTKILLSKKISLETGIPKSLSLKLVENLLRSITEVLIKKKYFKYKNFGILRISTKKERIGRNPKTLKKHVISSRKTVTFKISDNLKKRMN